MTMEMILKHPVCEVHEDSVITDEQIESIKAFPIWFTYAKNDRSC